MTVRLRPNRVRRTYFGGRRIDAFTGMSATCMDGVPRPEDWMASTVTAFNGTDEIRNEGLGRLEDGRFVRDVVGDLPFLVKLLDSDERLVIQAHPSVSCAQRLFGSSVGKTECWYFLPGTDADAYVYLGFRQGVTRTDWEQAVLDYRLKRNSESPPLRSFHENNPLLPFLHRIAVKAGDFVFVDGGVPHAIGAGCFMVELQEPSDLMVVAECVTPSGRSIPESKIHGGLGWDMMFDVYTYGGLSFDEMCARYVRRAVDGLCICGSELTDRFAMWRMDGCGYLELSRSACVIVTDGAGEVNGLGVKKGDRILVADERNLETKGDATLVICA